MNSYRILLLDDDGFILSALRRELLDKRFFGHSALEIESFNSPAAALARVAEPDGYFDVVISDLHMPEMSGIDFLKTLREILPDAVSIVLSGNVDRESLMRAINEAHIDYFIAKPWHEYELKCALLQAIRRYDLLSENRQLAKQYLERFGLYHQLKRKDHYQLLIVDDDKLVLQALQRVLDHSYTQGVIGTYQLSIQAFADVDDAFQAARDQQFDLVICDYAMPGMNGVEFLRLFREVHPDAVRLLISGMADMGVLVAAVNTAGVSHFIDKPWREYQLRSVIDRAISHRELELDNRVLADLLRLRSAH